MENRFWFHSWDKYLTLLLALLGTGLFSSGVITWIAANWDYLSKFEKLFATQTLFVVLVGIGLWFSRRANSRIQTAFTWFSAAVVIGGLLALIGQIYQTGADPWQLFALWALLQVPLFLALPNIINALLLIGPLNIAFAVFLYDHNIIFFINIVMTPFMSSAVLMPIIFTLANFVLFVLGRAFPNVIDDPHKILDRTLACLVIAWLLNIGIYPAKALIILGVVFLGSLSWFFRTKQPDFFLYALFLIAAAFKACLILFSMAESLATLFFCGFMLLFLLVMLVFQLDEELKQKSPHLEYSVGVILLYLFLAGLGIAAMIAVAFLSGMFNKALFIVLSLSSISLGLHFKKQNKALFASMSFVLALILVYVDYSFKIDIYYDTSEISTEYILLILIYIAYGTVIYIVSNTLWAKAVSAFYVLLITFNLGTILNQHESFGWDAYYYFPNVIGLVAFYLSTKSKKTHWQAIGWGALLLLIFFDAQYALYLRYETYEEITRPQLNQPWQFVNLATNGFLTDPLETQIWKLGFMLAPTLFFVLFNQENKAKLPWLTLISILFLSIAFIGNIVISIIFCILLCAYQLRSRLLFVLSLLYFTFVLLMYYYSMAIPLLYKSLLLLSCGALFTFVALWRYRVERATQPETQGAVQPIKKPLAIATVVSLISTLGLANYSIVQNEDVLNHGEPIVLELAPVDPRSLMQGDYMALNFSLLTDVRKLLDERENVLPKMYALLKFDAAGVATLCRVEKDVPSDFSGCAEKLYLPIKAGRYGNWFLPSHEFFFAEGKGEHYAQAKYGEYRFKDGKALLTRLLDKDRQPL